MCSSLWIKHHHHGKIVSYAIFRVVIFFFTFTVFVKKMMVILHVQSKRKESNHLYYLIAGNHRSRVSPLGVEVLRLSVRDRHEGLVWTGQWRRWGAHLGPALRVGGAVKPRGNGWAVPPPRRTRRGSVSCRQRLRFWLLVHGFHLVLLCAAPGETQGGRHPAQPVNQKLDP